MFLYVFSSIHKSVMSTFISTNMMNGDEEGLRNFVTFCSGRIDKIQIEEYAKQLKSFKNEERQHFRFQLMKDHIFEEMNVSTPCYANILFICNKYFQFTEQSDKENARSWTEVIDKILHRFADHIQQAQDMHDKKHIQHVQKLLETWKQKRLFTGDSILCWENFINKTMEQMTDKNATITTSSSQNTGGQTNINSTQKRKRGYSDAFVNQQQQHHRNSSSSSAMISDTSPFAFLTSPSPATPSVSENQTSITDGIKEEMILSVYSFIWKLFEPIGKQNAGQTNSEQIFWKILTISAFWLLHNYEDDISISDDPLAIGFACIYLAGKAEHYFIKTDKLRTMAQRIVKDCFGSDELPSDKAIFRYEMELLQCIQFNINLIQNPIPLLRTWELDKIFDHQTFLRTADQLCQFSVLSTKKLWTYTKELVALLFLIVYLGSWFENGKQLRERIKYIFAPKKIVDLLRSEATAFLELMKILHLELSSSLSIINITMLCDTVLDLHQRIVSPHAPHTPIPSTPAANETTPSVTAMTPSSSTPFTPAISMHIQSPIPNQTCSSTSSPVLLVSPLPTIATIPTSTTTVNTTTNTTTNTEAAEDKRPANNAEKVSTKKTKKEEIKAVEEGEEVDASSSGILQLTREDSFVEDLVEDAATLDRSIDSIVQQAMEERQVKLQQPSQEKAEEEKEKKQEAKLKQVKIPTIVLNEEEGNLSATPLDHTTFPRPSTFLFPPPSTEQQRLQQQHNNVQVINQETLDQMCRYRSQSLSPAASITTAVTFSPNSHNLMEPILLSAPTPEEQRGGGGGGSVWSRLSRASSVTTVLPLTELTLQDPDRPNNSNAAMLNNEMQQKQQAQDQTLPSNPTPKSDTIVIDSDVDQNQQQHQLSGVKRPRTNLNFSRSRVGGIFGVAMGGILNRHSSRSSICSSGTERDDPKDKETKEKTCDNSSSGDRKGMDDHSKRVEEDKKNEHRKEKEVEKEEEYRVITPHNNRNKKGFNNQDQQHKVQGKDTKEATVEKSIKKEVTATAPQQILQQKHDPTKQQPSVQPLPPPPLTVPVLNGALQTSRTSAGKPHHQHHQHQHQHQRKHKPMEHEEGEEREERDDRECDDYPHKKPMLSHPSQAVSSSSSSSQYQQQQQRPHPSHGREVGYQNRSQSSSNPQQQQQQQNRHPPPRHYHQNHQNYNQNQNHRPPYNNNDRSSSHQQHRYDGKGGNTAEKDDDYHHNDANGGRRVTLFNGNNSGNNSGYNEKHYHYDNHQANKKYRKES